MPGRRRTFDAMQHRDFALLWWGQTISSLGDGIFTIALALVALEIDKHPSGIAYVFAARAVPSVLLALVGGVVVDRVPRRTAMLVSDCARGAAVTVVAVLVASHALHLYELIVMSAVFGAADAFFGPASMALVPEILPDDLLVSGNSLSQASNQLTQGLFGPAVGGILASAIGVAWSFGVDAASFVVSCLTLLAIRTRVRASSSGQSLVGDAREGLRFVKDNTWLWVSLIAAALANFFGIAPLSVLLPLLVRVHLHGGATTLGLVLGAGGLSGLVASLVVARAGSPPHRYVVLWMAYALAGAAIVGLDFVHSEWLVGLLSSIEVGLIVYGDVLWVATMQQLVPREYMGRVSSLVYLFAFSLGPLGILSGGALATWIGIPSALLLCGSVSGAICVVVPILPGGREVAERLRVAS